MKWLWLIVGHVGSQSTSSVPPGPCSMGFLSLGLIMIMVKCPSFLPFYSDHVWKVHLRGTCLVAFWLAEYELGFSMWRSAGRQMPGWWGAGWAVTSCTGYPWRVNCEVIGQVNEEYQLPGFQIFSDLSDFGSIPLPYPWETGKFALYPGQGWWWFIFLVLCLALMYSRNAGSVGAELGLIVHNEAA